MSFEWKQKRKGKKGLKYRVFNTCHPYYMSLINNYYVTIFQPNSARFSIAENMTSKSDQFCSRVGCFRNLRLLHAEIFSNNGKAKISVLRLQCLKQLNIVVWFLFLIEHKKSLRGTNCRRIHISSAFFKCLILKIG